MPQPWQEKDCIDVCSRCCGVSFSFFLVFWSILCLHQSVPYCLSSISCGTHAVLARPLSHFYTHTHTHAVVTAEGSELSAEGWILGAGPKMCHSGHAWPAGGRNSVANGPRSRRHHLGIWETGWMDGGGLRRLRRREGGREERRERVRHNVWLINRRKKTTSIHLPIYLPTIYLLNYLSVNLLKYLSTHLPIYPPIYVPIYPWTIHLYIHLSIYPSSHSFIYLLNYLPTYLPIKAALMYFFNL